MQVKSNLNPTNINQSYFQQMKKSPVILTVIEIIKGHIVIKKARFNIRLLLIHSESLRYGQVSPLLQLVMFFLSKDEIH